MIVLCILVLIILIFNITSTVNVFKHRKKERLNLLRLTYFSPVLHFFMETSHFFWRPKQMTGFYMKRNLGLK